MEDYRPEIVEFLNTYISKYGDKTLGELNNFKEYCLNYANHFFNACDSEIIVKPNIEDDGACFYMYMRGGTQILRLAFCPSCDLKTLTMDVKLCIDHGMPRLVQSYVPRYCIQ